MKVRRMKERLGSIEEEVGQLEAGIADCESALANFVSAEETRRIAELLEARRAELAALMGEWEEISHSIEAHS
jgi:exonuclease VII small subunit